MYFRIIYNFDISEDWQDCNEAISSNSHYRYENICFYAIQPFYNLHNFHLIKKCSSDFKHVLLIIYLLNNAVICL